MQQTQSKNYGYCNQLAKYSKHKIFCQHFLFSKCLFLKQNKAPPNFSGAFYFLHFNYYAFLVVDFFAVVAFFAAGFLAAGFAATSATLASATGSAAGNVIGV